MMRKKIAALFCTLAVLCACLCGTVLAAKKPSIELMGLYAIWDEPMVSKPIIYFRVNSSKTIKYADWYVSAYNRVGDKASMFPTKKLTMVGPLEPFSLGKNVDFEWMVQSNAREDSPFRHYKIVPYTIAAADGIQFVYQDAYGNLFVKPDENNPESYTYLSEDEIQNAMFDYSGCEFPDVWWRDWSIDYLAVDKVVITYMDGSTETVTNVNSKYRDMTLQNPPFAQQLAQYDAVYNYQEYLRLNPDLADVIGTNQKALFEHFISSGMKEGRQGSSGFNLDAYKANNPDLVAAFGNDNVKYYDHYITSGKAEGRIAK